MSDISYERFVRVPFAVRACKITADNIEQVAEKIGTVKEKNGEKYIQIDKRVIPNIAKAHIGYYLTILDGNLRCYSAKIFNDQFVDMPEGQSIRFGFTTDDDGEEMMTSILADFPDAEINVYVAGDVSPEAVAEAVSGA